MSARVCGGYVLDAGFHRATICHLGQADHGSAAPVSLLKGGLFAKAIELNF
jgi:hypothetical protein